MAFTMDQLTALDEAIAMGALTVKYRDKEVTYRSLTDMLRIRELMASQLLTRDDGVQRVYVETSKGFCGE